MDLIGYHECGRRLGVSDTAVRKAVLTGRIKIAGRTDKSQRPLVDWDEVMLIWNSSGDVRKRGLIGSQGSPRRAKDRPLITIPDSRHMDETPMVIQPKPKPVQIEAEIVPETPKKREKKAKIKPKKPEKAPKKSKSAPKQDETKPGTKIDANFEPTELPKSEKAGRYADSRAEREEWEAKLAQLKYETQMGILVNAEEVKFEFSKIITAAKTSIMGIPALCKSRYSDLPVPVVSLIEQVCLSTLEDLANGAGL
jgi:hypothetical protein